MHLQALFYYIGLTVISHEICCAFLGQCCEAHVSGAECRGRDWHRIVERCAATVITSVRVCSSSYQSVHNAVVPCACG